MQFVCCRYYCPSRKPQQPLVCQGVIDVGDSRSHTRHNTVIRTRRKVLYLTTNNTLKRQTYTVEHTPEEKWKIYCEKNYFNYVHFQILTFHVFIINDFYVLHVHKTWFQTIMQHGCEGGNACRRTFFTVLCLCGISHSFCLKIDFIFKTYIIGVKLIFL